MKCINKIKLYNFKRFKTFSVGFDEKLNLLVGDNESGKSSILEAINLVLNGSRSKVETAGLENIFNSQVIAEYFSSLYCIINGCLNQPFLIVLKVQEGDATMYHIAF